MFLVFAFVRVIMIEYTLNMINKQYFDILTNLCCISVGKTPQNRTCIYDIDRIHIKFHGKQYVDILFCFSG